MSGIAVIYDSLASRQDIELLARKACQVLQRSEREEPIECYNGPGFSLGRCRPVLINRAPQPAWNEERTICAFFHGELFGYQSLRRSLEQKGHQFSGDSYAEFVIHLYEDRGSTFIHELNGGFALALWDSCQQKLIIANDRYGLRPLYLAQFGGKYFLASAPKAILADSTFSRQINLAALADFLYLGIPQGDDTMFEGIDELPPATMVICQEGQIRCQQYWDLSLQEEETGIPAGDYLDGLIPLLKQAAERRQTGNLNIGLLLSGGLDSRIVFSVLKKDNLKTFTYGTSSCSDVRLARQVAQATHVPFVALEITPNYLETYAQVGLKRTEDLISCNKFHGISVYDSIASQVNTLTTGTSGEWIFGRFDQNPHHHSWGDGFSVDYLYDSHLIMTDEELEQLVKPAYFQQMKGLARVRFHKDFEKYSSRHVTNRVDHWSVRQKHRRLFNRMSNLFPNNLEYRPLFYDNDLVDFAQTIPPSLRWGENSVYRQIVLRAAPKLARIPATTTLGLPLTATRQEVARHKNHLKNLNRWHHRLNRITLGLIPPTPKTDFYVNYAEWLRQDLRDWAASILLDSQTLSRVYWQPSAISRLWEAALQAKKGAAEQVAALITFELWHRTYLDPQ